MNSVNLIGRLTRDIELKHLEGTGTAMARFSIAIDRNIAKDKKQEMESKNLPTADFINIVTWGKTAEFAANYLKKGSQVGITGRLQSGSYQNKEGHTIYTTDINASQIHMIDWGNRDNSTNDGSDISGFNPVDSNDIPF